MYLLVMGDDLIMSWSVNLTADKENVERKVADAVLPDYADKTEEHMKQLHLAKSAALHLVAEWANTNNTLFHITMAGHNYTESNSSKEVCNVGVNVTSVS